MITGYAGIDVEMARRVVVPMSCLACRKPAKFDPGRKAEERWWRPSLSPRGGDLGCDETVMCIVVVAKRKPARLLKSIKQYHFDGI